MLAFQRTTARSHTHTHTQTYAVVYCRFDFVHIISISHYFHKTHLFNFQWQDLSTIDIGSNGDQVGCDVALSGDGQTMAVGAPWADVAAGDNRGITRLFGKNGTEWIDFQQIDGPTGNNYFGWSVALSDDGSTLVIGAYDRSAYIYDFDHSNKKYGLLNATYMNAWQVSVSGDGNTVGVTSKVWSSGAKIFVKDGAGFQERGIFPSGYGQQSGIALNEHGNIAVVGDYDWSYGKGRVGVFQKPDDNGEGSTEWEKLDLIL